MTSVVVRPDATRLDRALERARATRSEIEVPVAFDHIPPGFRLSSTREVVGRGLADSAAARRAVSSWTYLPRWIRAHPGATPQTPGQTLLVVANTFGLRWLLPARVTESVLDTDGSRRGFVYVALDGHVARGYERFVVEYDPATTAVTFDITAVARPTQPILRIVPPVFWMLQWWFRRRAMRRVRAAVRGEKRGEAPGGPGAS